MSPSSFALGSMSYKATQHTLLPSLQFARVICFSAIETVVPPQHSLVSWLGLTSFLSPTQRVHLSYDGLSFSDDPLDGDGGLRVFLLR
jgi:hypothetical protein